MPTKEANERVGERLRLLNKHDKPEVDDEPASVYELVTRTSLEELAKDVDEIKSRVNTLLWGVGGAVMLDVVMRLAGR